MNVENKNFITDAEFLMDEAKTRSLAVHRPAALMSLSSYEDSLDAYLNQISKIPLLSKEDEVKYARRYKQHHDMEAAQYLVLSNLRFVVYVAKGYKNYGLPLSDIIQEGNLGLMKAVAKFDPDQNVRFISYAVYWIRCDINEYIIKNMRMVRSITNKNRRKLLFNLSKHMKKGSTFTYKEREGLAETYGVKISDIDIVEAAIMNHDSSVEFQNVGGVSTAELLPDNQSPEKEFENSARSSQHKGLVTKMLEKLDDRQREIIKSRWLSVKKTSLETLAKRYKISMQRVSQIEKQAIEKCKEVDFSTDDLLLEDEVA